MSQENSRERCPICGSLMRGFRTHYWRDKKLTFPYEIYRCQKHGIFVWREGKHELVDFSVLQHEADVDTLPKDANVQLFDPTIVDMKCPICGEEWTQYKEFPSAASGGVVFCPNNHSVERETALQKG